MIHNSLFKIHSRGAVVLPTVLMLSSLIVGMAIVGALVVYILSNSNYSVRLSSGALAAARTGINDGALRVFRGVTAASYSITVNSTNDVQVIINDCGTANNIARKDIYAIATMATRTRKLRAVVTSDLNTGQIVTLSIEEVLATSGSVCL